MALRHDITHDGFRKLDEDIIFIAGSQDVHSVRELCENEIRRVIDDFAFQSFARPFSWDVEIGDEGMDQSRSMQSNIPKSSDAHCLGVICLVGERIGHSLPSTFREESIPGIEGWTQPDHGYRLLHPWPEKLEDQRTRLEEGCYPLTGTVFEFLEAHGSQQPDKVWLCLIAEREIVPGDEDVPLNGFSFRNAKSRKMTTPQLHQWLETDYDLQTRAVHNFMSALVKRGIAQNAKAEPAQIGRAVRAFVRDHIIFSRGFRNANPYKHLHHYTADDHSNFYGRKRDIDTAITLLRRGFDRPRQPRTLEIAGASGCGKSSLLQAGILPRLMTDPYNRGLYETVSFRPEAFVQPDGQPRNVISAILAMVDRDTSLRISAADIYNLEGQGLQAPAKAVELLEGLLAQGRDGQGARLVIGIDQFEEIVDRLAIPTQRIYWLPLIEFISSAAKSPRVAVVYTLESARRHALRNLDLGPAFGSAAPIELDESSLSFFAEIIEEPFKQHGYPLSGEVVSKLLENIRALKLMGGANGSLLPLIALRLSKLFEKMQEMRPPIPPESRDAIDFAVGKTSQGSPFVQVSDLKQEDFDFEAEISRQAKVAWRRAGQGASIDLSELDHFLRPFVGIGGEDGAQIQLLIAPHPHYSGEQQRADSFRRERLLIETDGGRQLVHEAVIRFWPEAREWLEKRKQYLQTENWMRKEVEAREAGRWADKNQPVEEKAVTETEVDAAGEILYAHLRDWPLSKSLDPLHAYCLEIFRHSRTPGKPIPLINGAESAHTNCAAFYGMADLLEVFHEIDPASLDRPGGNLGRKPLASAAWTSLGAVKYLLSKGVDPIARDEKGWPAIAAAITEGDERIFKVILQASQGRGFEGPKGSSLLHICAWRNRVDMARLLIDDYGFDPGVKDENNILPLHLAAQAGNLECFSFFRSRSDAKSRSNNGWNCFHFAAAAGKLEIVTLLLSDPHFREESAALTDGKETALHLACQGSHAEVVRQLLSVLDPNQPAPPDDPRGLRPIHVALRKESEWSDRDALIATLKELLADPRTDPNLPNQAGYRPLALLRENRTAQKLLLGDGRIQPLDPVRPGGPTPLFLAAKLGDWPSLRKLMERAEADVHSYRDAEGSFQIYRDSKGSSLLHQLAEKNAPRDLLDIALRRGTTATLNDFDESGNTPLTAALQGRRWPTAKTLLNTGQLVLETKDPKGWTLLHRACAHQQMEWLEFLKPYLSGRADLWSILDRSGRRPIDLLRRSARIDWPGAEVATDWPTPKTWSTDLVWEPLDAESRADLLKEVSPIDGKHESRAVSDIVAARLPFYDDRVRLIRLRDVLWLPSALAVYYLSYQGKPYRLNGTSPPIHQINAISDDGRPLLSLTEENVLDYLRFFCFFVRGEEGPFLITESSDQAEIPRKLTADEIAAISDASHPTWLNCDEPLPKEFFCSALVYYSTAIFTAEFKIQKTGMIDMLDDQSVASSLSHLIDRPLT